MVAHSSALQNNVAYMRGFVSESENEKRLIYPKLKKFVTPKNPI